MNTELNMYFWRLVKSAYCVGRQKHTNYTHALISRFRVVLEMAATFKVGFVVGGS